MRILIVHEVSYRKKVVYEYQDFPERLASMGHTVSVIDFDETGDNIYRKEEITKTNIGTITLENTPYINIPFIKYLSGRVNYKKILREKLKNREIDVVLLYSVFVSGVSTVKLCRKYGVPVVYRVLDIYHKIRRNLLYFVPLYFGEKFIYRNADVVCVANRKMADYVSEMASGKIKRMETLHHGVDLPYFARDGKSRAMMEKYGINPEDRVALFLGTTYSFSGLDAVLSQIDRLRKKVPGCKVMIVGSGDLDGKLKEMVEKEHIPDCIILTGMRPYSEVPDLLSLADVCFNSFHINSITRDIIPIKILQYLAAGKPVVCAPIPDVMKMFPEESSGILYCDISDPASYADTITRILSDEEYASRLAANALRFVTEHYSIQNQIAELENLLEMAKKEAEKS